MLFQWPKLSASLFLIGSAALAAAHPGPRVAARTPCAGPVAVDPEPVGPEPEARPAIVARAPAAPAPAENPDQLLEQARRHLLAGEHGPAHDKLQRCLQLDPTAALCHRTLGVLYASTGRPRASLAHYRRYVDLRPDAPDARLVRAIVERAERLFYPKL